MTYYAIMHHKVWNGYWYVRKNIPFFRKLGRLLKSKRIYWLGFQIIWIHGMKEYMEEVNNGKQNYKSK